MNDQRFYSLIELKSAAEAACHPYRVVEVHEWRNEHGERGYTVFVDSYADISWSVGALAKAGFEGVEVVTDW